MTADATTETAAPAVTTTTTFGWAVTSDPSVHEALGLSAVEATVLTMAATGSSVETMQRSLLLPAEVVEAFLRGAYHSAGVRDRQQALRWAVAEGLLTPVVRDAETGPRTGTDGPSPAGSYAA